MGSANIDALIAPLQPFAQALVDLAGRAGVQPRVTSTLRTHSQQQRLYDQYLRGESKYPVAPPGSSAHEYGFAFDMVASTAEDLHDLGSVWTQWGGLWSPHDEVHFEYPGFTVPTAEEIRSVDQNSPIPCGGVLGFLGYRCTALYKAEDFVISALTPLRWTIVELLLQAGYPQSEAVRISSSPVSELHRKYPWLPI